MIKNKKIFITGGAGFIAYNIIKKLIYYNKIIVFDNFSRDTISQSKIIKHPNILIIKDDILNLKSLKDNMVGSNIVIHCAAIAGIDTVLMNPSLTMKVNMIGTANVLEAAKINNIKGRFIDFSTSEVFGNYAYKSSEESNTTFGNAGEARWSYAVSKISGEHLTAAYFKEFKLPTVIVRPFNIYGPGQTGEGAIQIFIKKALQNKTINVFGDGNQIRSWCYIDDFIKCILTALENRKAIGESFNIGNSRSVMTTVGLAQMICRVLNSKSLIKYKPPLSADVELRIPSVDKAYKILGFKAKVDIEEGIIKTAKWIEKNLL